MDCVPLNHLESELVQELTSAALVTRFARWRREGSVLARFRQPRDVLRFMRCRPSSAEEDAVLGALLAQAASDPLAGRLVLLAVLPGLKNVARRSLMSAEEREELWSALLACAWEQIRSYPLERRPRRIAANLLLDTMRSALATMREGRPPTVPLAPEQLLAATAPPSVERDVETLLHRAVDAGAISPREAELVLCTRFDGIPLAHVADAHGEPYNRVKVRRQRAERRLLVWLGYRPVPRGNQKRPLCSARVAGAGHRPDRRI
jgi:DNA-directed RNA polymerase specialized sigma24 family protein